MESERSSRIWTPKEKPVVLDKFCHLTLDAQKVMASMYRDFHHRKAEITKDFSMQNAAQRGAFNRSYLQTKPSSASQYKDGSFQEQRNMNVQGPGLHDRNLPDLQHQGAQDKRHRVLNMYTSDAFKESEKVGVFNSKKSSLPMSVNGTSETSQARSPNIFTGDDSTVTDLSFRCNNSYTAQLLGQSISEGPNFNIESPAVETRDFEILSQFHVVNTQDDLFSESENRTSEATDSGRSNLFNASLNTGKCRRELESRCSAASSVGSGAYERSAVLEHCPSGMTGFHLDGRQDSLGLDTNNMVRDMNGNLIRKVTETFGREDGLCEESPYLDRTPEVNRKLHTAVAGNKSSKEESCKKNRKLKQTKITFEKLRPDKHRDVDSGSDTGKKHFIGEDGDSIPGKKLKLGKLTDDESVRRFSSDIVYVNELTVADVELVCSEILQAEEVVLCLVFANGCTQLRGNLFGTDSKTHKKQVGKLKKDSEIDSISLWRPDAVEHKVYLFSKLDKRQAVYEKLRLVILEHFTEHRKYQEDRFQTKDVILTLFTQFNFEYNRVDLSWTILDAGIAVWLLDPDKPVSCFEQLLSALNMPEQAPSKSCIDALQDDMALLSSAMKKLYKMLQSKEMWMLFVCLETKLVNVLAGMERRQISISIHTLLQFSAILKKSLTRLEDKAHKAAGHAFLLNSHHQLRQVLFEELQLDSHLPGKARLARTSVTRETSTSESVLTQLQPFHPLPAIILEYRQLQKLKSTYIDGILSCVTDGYLTTHWDQTAAATGRLTSHHPNIQAIPKLPVLIKNHETNFIVAKQSKENDDAVLEFNARDPFISKPHWSLLAADFQQIELRLLGHLADDPVLINIFCDTNVPDIFNALAAQWLGKGITDVTEADREQTKRVVYSVMYGVGKEKLADYLKCSSESAKAIMASFLLKFPAVNQFTKSCVEFCQKHGYTFSVFKRRRLFPNIRHSNPTLRAQAERQCVNFCVQGSAADICKAAMLQVENALAENPALKARLLVQIHDELLLEVADSDLNKVARLVKNVMESEEKLCGSVVDLKVPIPVSLSVGKTWGHMEHVLVATNED